jgi:hypothetical protein
MSAIITRELPRQKKLPRSIPIDRYYRASVSSQIGDLLTMMNIIN